MIKKKNIYFGDKLEKFEVYCKKTGRSLSALVVIAIEQYIIRNPPK